MISTDSSPQDNLLLPPLDKRKALSAWIANFDWKWMATLTFKDAVGAERAERTFRRFENGLNILQFGKGWKSDGHRGVHWFRVSEYQQRGVLHYHVLFGNLNTPKRPFDRAAQARVRAIWTSKAGHFDLSPVQSRDAVCRYIAKHYGRGAEIDVSRSLRAKDFCGSRLL